MPNSQKTGVPKPLPSNPGKGFKGSIAFTNGERSWVEPFNLVGLLASSLAKLDHQVHEEESWLVLENSAFTFLPQIVEFKPSNGGGVQTTTTIQTNHPALAPEGVFEYQHSAGRNVEESLLDGFTQWAKTDLIALIEALQPKPPTCNVLDMEIPERNGRPAYRRRAVLGPVTHLQQYPRDIPEQTNAHSAGGNQGEHCEGHEFCPCCLLTSSFEAFKELIESDSFYGLRLFAMRNQSGNPQAGCRVNGDDWEKGAEALRKYVGTWPVGGLEFRKQYVVLQTIKNRG
jgi:hypothetical protein